MNNSILKQIPFYTLVMSLVVAVTMVVVNLASMGDARAAEFKTGMITVKNVWARATPRSGGAFMVIHNMGPADELVGVKGDMAKKVQTHETVNEGGVMKMKHVHAIPVPAKGMAMLKPGSYHVMMMGLHKPLKVGSHVPLTLVFKNAGELKVMAKVQKLGAKAPMDHSKMDHDKMDHGKMDMGKKKN